MNQYQVYKLLERGIDALERIATAVEKLSEEPKDESERSIRGFDAGNRDR